MTLAGTMAALEAAGSEQHRTVHRRRHGLGELLSHHVRQAERRPASAGRAR